MRRRTDLKFLDRPTHANLVIPLLTLLFLLLPWGLGYRIGSAQVTTSITATPGPAGLGTLVKPPNGNVYGIQGGTLKGSNLYHSFAQFNVGAGDLAQFQTTNLLPNTSVGNILSRVTGGPSSIFGGIDSATFYPNANFFFMNPAGILFGPNATVSIGGMAHFTTADYLRLDDIGGTNAGIFHADPARTSVLTAAPVSAFGFLGPNPAAAIEIQGSTLTLATGTGISLIGGNISIGADPESGVTPYIAAPNGRINLVSVASPGEVLFPSLQTGSNINNQSFTALGNISINPGSILDVSGESSGTVHIRGGQLVLDNGFILAGSFGDVDGPASAVHIDISGAAQIKNQSVIDATSSGAGKTGDISINAHTLSVTDGSIISAQSFGSAPAGNISFNIQDTFSLSGVDAFGNGSLVITAGSGVDEGGTVMVKASNVTIADQATIRTEAGNVHAGAITMDVGNLTIANGGSLQAFGGDLGPSGNISIKATDSISLQGQGDFNTRILSQNVGAGGTGTITIEAQSLALTNGSQILSETNFNPGGTNVPKLSIKADSLSMSDGSRIDVKTSHGDVGALEISARTVALTGQALIETTTLSEGASGPITVLADTVSLSGGSQINSSTGGIDATGRGGNISLTANNTLSLQGNFTDGSGVVTPTAIQSSTGFGSTGNAGDIAISAGNVIVSDGAFIASQSVSGAAGNAGSVTINSTASPAQSVVIDGLGSGIFTNTSGSGSAGSILVNANSVALQNSAHISSSSTGTGVAGSITINAGNQLSMTNSSITTEANQSSGGAIKITTTPEGSVLLTNSLISASVLDGTGGGGSVNIDPQSVVLINSQILANAVFGPGGNIFITTNLLLPDTASVISASSQFGQQGTITVQSPISPASGKIVPLGQKPLVATSLLSQRCAAIAGGNYSSFTLAGRDTLPTEPGSWLSSPLALGNISENTGLQATNESDPPLLSLRQIAPPGFLTQIFAVDPSDCQS